ncbi:MAG: methionine sulfoxide reductase heme-binding subunit, partial [Acidimicrobiia bacterium]|nr:methionine sulfoxide reductase heme-binding subunit [Acidimicrobiia bacterium]
MGVRLSRGSDRTVRSQIFSANWITAGRSLTVVSLRSVLVRQRLRPGGGAGLLPIVISTAILLVTLLTGPLTQQASASFTNIVEENAKATVDNARAGEAVSIDDPGATALHKTAATAGFLAYGLMVGTLAWGMLTTTGLARRSIRRQTLYGGHMTMSIMTLSFMLVHVLANVFNPRGALSASSALVPLAGAQPFGVSLGVISAELLVAVAVSIGFQRIV